jgi:hypothetical protein
MNALQLKVIEMTDRRPGDTRASHQPEWSGLAEIDQAIVENRLTSYRWKKAWADPLNRSVTIGTAVIVATVSCYLLGAGFGWW